MSKAVFRWDYPLSLEEFSEIEKGLYFAGQHMSMVLEAAEKEKGFEKSKVDALCVSARKGVWAVERARSILQAAVRAGQRTKDLGKAN